VNSPDHRTPLSFASHPDVLQVHLVCFEQTRDDIVAYWQNCQEVEEGVRALWCSDVREAHQAMLRALDPEDPKGRERTSPGETYTYLQGRLECVSSELRTRSDGPARALRELWEVSGHAILRALQQRAAARLEQDRGLQLSLLHPDLVRQIQVVRTGDERYELFCCACGRRAAAFEVGESPWRAQKALLYEGSAGRQSFRLGLAHAIFAALGDKHVGRAHDVLIAHGACRSGIDAWCPSCEATYCSDHYVCVDTYHEGIYDATHATCPRGHRRRLAD
jgi:hypothetical protein